MVDHSVRDHAQWSASSTERNWACPGALAMVEAARAGKPEKSNEAADWGTCCHQVAEKCLRGDFDAADLIGTTEKGKTHEFEVDEEMAETAMEYVNYVRGRENFSGDGDAPARLFIEQKFSLEALNPPFEAGGTADAVIYNAYGRSLEVIDLKGGRGHVVEVEGNPQLRTYALGAMLANNGVPIDTITVTIVQPRAPHKSGRIRSETFHVAELVEWTADLLAAMRRSREAADLHGIQHDAAWASDYLRAGDHCKFCDAAGFCPALEQKALDTAGIWFDDMDQPRLSNSPDMLSPERAQQLLDAADMMGDYINAVRAYWHDQAEAGVEIPGYMLVAKEGREKWSDGVEEQVIVAAERAGLAHDKFMNAPKLKTPKQVRKALGTKASIVADLSFTPQNGTNLVRADKTTRSAVTPAAHKHFSILD